MNARNKYQPKYDDYVSYPELVSMFNACSAVATGDRFNYRVYSTGVYLVLEIALKKLAIHYGISVSTTNHKIGSLLHNLSFKDLVVGELANNLQRSGLLPFIQRFPYDALRFNSVVDRSILIDHIELSKVTMTVLRRLEYIESVRRNKGLM